MFVATVPLYITDPCHNQFDLRIGLARKVASLPLPSNLLYLQTDSNQDGTHPIYTHAQMDEDELLITLHKRIWIVLR